MKTIFELMDEVNLMRENDASVFGVSYVSKSNPSNRHYTICKNEIEFENLKQSYKDWDYSFYKVN